MVLDDLGFGPGTGEEIELTTSPDILRRVLKRLRDLAVKQKKSEEIKRAEDRESEQQNGTVLSTCEFLLSALEVP